MTLVPPPITPGPWFQAEDSTFIYALTQDGWRKGEPQMVNRFSASIQRGKDTTEEELLANTKMMHAAPAMAEVLADLLELAQGIEVKDLSKAARFGVASKLTKAHSALLAAGYTLKD